MVQPQKKRRQGDYQRGRELARTPKQELKAFDLAYTTQQVSTIAGPPNFNCLNAMINGSELYQRVGRKTYMKSLHIRGWFDATNAAAIPPDVIRMIVFYDSQPNAAASAVTDLLQNSNAAAATTVFSGLNLVNRERFKILRDQVHTFPQSIAVAGEYQNVPDTSGIFAINEFIKLKGLESVYNGTNGGTSADITSGALWIVTISQHSTDWTFNFQSRLRYYD